MHAHRSEGVPDPPPRAPLPAMRNSRRRRLRRQYNRLSGGDANGQAQRTIHGSHSRCALRVLSRSQTLP
eukprot:7585285-Pyramimonas_sp.AAC.1